MAATDQLLDQLPRTTTFDAEDLLFVSHAGTAYATPAGTFKGPQGAGISGIAKTGSSGLVDTYTVTLTDGTTATFTVTNGEQGEQGEQGTQGETGNGIASATLNADYTLTLTYTNGQTQTVGPIRGEPGEGVTDLNPPETASGSVVTFTSAAAGNPVNPLIVNIEPVQSGSGNPSPDNVRPITGWTGAKVTRAGENLFDESVADYVEGKVISPTGEIATNYTYKYGAHYYNISSGTYTLSCVKTTSNYGLSFAFYDNNKSFLERVVLFNANTTGDRVSTTFTPPSGAAYYRITFGIEGITDIHLNSGSTATYDAYTISFGSAGTVYGGTLDVARGLLTVNRVSKSITNCASVTEIRTGWYRAAVNTGDSITRGGETLCNLFPFSGSWTGYGVTVTSTGAAYFVSDISDWSTASGFDAWAAANNLQLVYCIATPMIYQLTPQEITTLLGTNNIQADCGDVDVTYRAGEKPAVLTVKDIGVAGGAASYSDYAVLEARVAALEQALANS